MALINCPECGSEVSKKAKTCPKCGHPIKKKGIGCGPAILIIFLIIIIAGIIGNMSKKSSGPISPEPPKIVSKDELIKKFKEIGREKASADLAGVGIENFAYKSDNLYIYVRDYRWDNLTELQKEKVISIFDTEWSTVVQNRKHQVYILNYETKKVVEYYE